MIEIKIINRSRHPLPSYETAGSAGMDIRAFLSETLQLAPLQRVLIPTGLYLEIPQGYEAQVRPRSGLALKQGITLLNTPGTIDADYRGELGIILINLSEKDVFISDGDRIAQLIINPVSRASWISVAEISDTERGIGGFGHTGNK